MKSPTLFMLASWVAASTLIIFGVACKQKRKSSFLKDDIRYFQDILVADMEYKELVEAFGPPMEDLNASSADQDGLHIYQYPLYDSTFVRIGYMDKIVYACLVDDSSNVMEDIIIIETTSE